MMEQLLGAIFGLGMSEAESVLVSAGENMVKNYKDSRAWEKLLVDTGDFFIKTEKGKDTFFEELTCNASNIVST